MSKNTLFSKLKTRLSLQWTGKYYKSRQAIGGKDKNSRYRRIVRKKK